MSEFPLVSLKKKNAVTIVAQITDPAWLELAHKTEARMKAEDRRYVMASFVFAYWALKRGYPRALFDDKRAKRLCNRLLENGDDVDELLYVVDGAGKDKWISGKDERSTRAYDGIETIFRDRAQVERLAHQCAAYRKSVPHPQAERYRAELKTL